jgi:hypothetical protein
MVSDFKCAHMHTILSCLLINVWIIFVINFCIVIDIHTFKDLILWMFVLVKFFMRRHTDKYKTFFVVLTLLKFFSNKVHQIISFHGWIFYRRELLFRLNKFFELACFNFKCVKFFNCVNFRSVNIFKDGMLWYTHTHPRFQTLFRRCNLL